jgi:hypothetical protein
METCCVLVTAPDGAITRICPSREASSPPAAVSVRVTAGAARSVAVIDNVPVSEVTGRVIAGVVVTGDVTTGATGSVIEGVITAVVATGP